MDQHRDEVRTYLWDLQQRITDTFGAIDGQPFRADLWRKEPGEPQPGTGPTKIHQGRNLFERSGSDVVVNCPPAP